MSGYKGESPGPRYSLAAGMWTHSTAVWHPQSTDAPMNIVSVVESLKQQIQQFASGPCAFSSSLPRTEAGSRGGTMGVAANPAGPQSAPSRWFGGNFPIVARNAGTDSNHGKRVRSARDPTSLLHLVALLHSKMN